MCVPCVHWIVRPRLVDAEIERATVLFRLRKFFDDMTQRWQVKLLFFRGSGIASSGDWCLDGGDSVSLLDVCKLWTASKVSVNQQLILTANNDR